MYELDFDVIRIVAVGNIKVQSGQWKCLAAYVVVNVTLYLVADRRRLQDRV